MSIKKSLCLLCVFLLCSAVVCAVDAESGVPPGISPAEYAAYPVGELHITGLKRTRRSVIDAIWRRQSVERLSEFDEEEFTQSLYKTGIFDSPEYVYILNGERVDVYLTVKEKWSLIPAPRLNITSEDQTYGALLMESNFLGLNKFLIITGAYSTKNGVDAFVEYGEPDLIPGKLGFTLGGGFGSLKDADWLDFDGEAQGQYSDLSFIGYGGLFYNLSSDFKVGVMGSFEHHGITNADYATGLEGAHQFLTGRLLLDYDRQQYTGTISTGFLARSILTLGRDFNTSSVFTGVDLAVTCTRQLAKNLYGRIGGDVSVLDKPYLQEMVWGATDHSRTLAPLNHDQHLAGSIEAEWAFLNLSWSSFSIKALYEAGLYQRDEWAWRSYHGPAVGTRMYLRGIAVPAMGIDFGYNVKDNYFNFSATIAF